MQTVSNLKRQLKTSYQHVQYWQKNSTLRNTIKCVMNYIFNIGQQIWAKLDNEHCMSMHQNW